MNDQIRQQEALSIKAALDLAKMQREALENERIETASKAKLKQLVADQYNKSFLRGDFKPKLTQAYLENFKGYSRTLEVINTYDRMLRSALYGVTKTPTGFSYAGQEYQTLSKLQDALSSQTGINVTLSTSGFAYLVDQVLTQGKTDLSGVRILDEAKEPDLSELTYNDRWTFDFLTGDVL